MHRRNVSSAVLVGCLFAVATQAQKPPTTVDAAKRAMRPKATDTEQAMYATALGPTDRRCVDADGAATDGNNILDSESLTR
jgi:hypothetical protein